MDEKPVEKQRVRPKTVMTYSGLGAAGMTFVYQAIENPEMMMGFMGEIAHNQIAQAGFFFTIAAWLHAGRVKKEIAANFTHLTDAINNVAKSFREDLERHSETLKNQSSELATLSQRVQNVENNLNIKR